MNFFPTFYPTWISTFTKVWKVSKFQGYFHKTNNLGSIYQFGYIKCDICKCLKFGWYPHDIHPSFWYCPNIGYYQAKAYITNQHYLWLAFLFLAKFCHGVNQKKRHIDPTKDFFVEYMAQSVHTLRRKN